MTANTAYFTLMFSGLGFMLLQLTVKHKTLLHLLFAVFCGSMAMVAAQELSNETLSGYKYLFGLGACATCNGMWLVSKAMFSGEASVAMRHVVFAISLALLIIINNSIDMAHEFSLLGNSSHARLADGLGELINLLSSTVLALTCWEALKDIKLATKHGFWQRIVFLISFSFGFLLCTVVAKTVFLPAELTEVFPILVTIAAIQIMVVTQSIIWWQQFVVTKISTVEGSGGENDEKHEIDEKLVSGIIRLVKENQGYLTPNLKMVDLANQLNVSEYKISRVIRYHFKAANFNQFINTLRIDHAKHLLSKKETQEWSVLVVAMESGFSSLATFNRVFKAQLGYAPKQHKEKSAKSI